jgi:hypothetical protein
LGRRVATIGVLVVAAVLVTYAFSFVLPEAVDWHVAFRPAALALLTGQNPYTVVDSSTHPGCKALARWRCCPSPSGARILPWAWWPCCGAPGAQGAPHRPDRILLSHFVVGGLVNSNID